jgi:hypothetical protein
VRVTLGALEIPRREAPEMQVVLVQSGDRPGARELDGDLDLTPGPTADGADGPDPETAPKPGGFGRQLAQTERFTRVFSKMCFVRYWTYPGCAGSEPTPDATRPDARMVNLGARWKALQV